MIESVDYIYVGYSLSGREDYFRFYVHEVRKYMSSFKDNYTLGVL